MKRARPPVVRRSAERAWNSIRYSTIGAAVRTASRQVSGASRITSSGSLPSGSRATRTSSSSTPASVAASWRVSCSSAVTPSVPARSPAGSTS